MNPEKNIARFEKEFAKINRDGAKELLEYIRKSDMYSAPGSTRFHLSVSGGLLQHSLNVLDALRALLQDNKDGTYATMVHIPACSTPRVLIGSGDGRSEGYIVRVYEDCIVFEGYEFVIGETFAYATYIIQK